MQESFGASIQHRENGEEYYLASEVSTFLGYTKWTAFLTVLGRARKVCAQAHDASEHFQPVEKLTPTGRGVTRSIDDYRLTREAFLLIVMNADTYLPMVAQGKTYIAESVIDAQRASMKHPTFTIQIDWSEEDQAYLVTLPGWTEQGVPVARGSTVKEALERGQQVIATLLEQESRKELL